MSFWNGVSSFLQQVVFLCFRPFLWKTTILCTPHKEIFCRSSSQKTSNSICFKKEFVKQFFVVLLLPAMAVVVKERQEVVCLNLERGKVATPSRNGIMQMVLLAFHHCSDYSFPLLVLLLLMHFSNLSLLTFDFIANIKQTYNKRCLVCLVRK